MNVGGRVGYEDCKVSSQPLAPYPQFIERKSPGKIFWIMPRLSLGWFTLAWPTDDQWHQSPDFNSNQAFSGKIRFLRDFWRYVGSFQRPKKHRTIAKLANRS